MFKKLLIILSLLTIPVNTWSAYNYNPFTDELDDIGDFSITDPNADRIIFWDDSEGAIGYLTAGTGLTISTTTLSVSNPSSWTTASNVAYLTTMTDTVSIGTSAAGGKLFIDGDADEIQLQVQGHSTQTNSLAVFENSAGTDVVTIANDGSIATGSGNGSIDIGSAGVRLTSDGDGAITFLGLGNGSDEDLTLNLDDTSNTGVISSSTSLDKLDFGAIKLASTSNMPGNPKHLRFTIVDPLAVQTKDNEVCIWPSTDAAITITGITVTLNASGNEVSGDLKYADAFIGLANPVVINDFDTTSGVRVDTSITSGSVPAGKCIYLSFDSAPNTAITQMSVNVAYDYD